jgi:hypothetical protein
MSDLSPPPAADPNAGATPGFGPAPQGFLPPPPVAPGQAGQPGLQGYGQAATDQAGNGKPGLAIAAGLGAAIVAGLVYAELINATKHSFGYAAIAIGLLIGAVMGRIGGREKSLPFIAVALAVVANFLGQFVGEALLGSKLSGVSTVTLLFSHTALVFDAWKYDMGAMVLIFYVIGGAEAYIFTRRFSGAAAPRSMGRRR